jgi:predicted nuclease of restriction endonuclease-like (RecB) superfamily
LRNAFFTGLEQAAERRAAAPGIGVVVKPANVGRNDPCPCGSGKEYKKCCWLKDQAAKCVRVGCGNRARAGGVRAPSPPVERPMGLAPRSCPAKDSPDLPPRDKLDRPTPAMSHLAPAPEERLYERIATILDEARGRVARTVNTAMVHAYWLIGREIVEVEQQGKERAGYGDELLRKLASKLTKRFGKGFNLTGLKRMRQFYRAFPQGSSLPVERGGPQKGAAAGHLSETVEKDDAGRGLARPSGPLFPASLSWTHYRLLLAVPKPEARAFYEIEAAREGWSVRELERQVAALLFERLAQSRTPDQVLALARQGQHVAAPADVLKDPFVLEFLDLKESPTAQERDLEQAIIDRLEDFLLELGKGFCFVARQKRLTLEGDHFYVDLVFYNRLLRCFVLIDLKLGKLTHQDLGQMQMYVNFFDRFQRAEHEAKTIGVVLCSDKNDAMVKITLPEDNEQILAARYQMYLPTEEELRAELARERDEAERVLRLADGGERPAP